MGSLRLHARRARRTRRTRRRSEIFNFLFFCILSFSVFSTRTVNVIDLFISDIYRLKMKFESYGEDTVHPKTLAEYLFQVSFVFRD